MSRSREARAESEIPNHKSQITNLKSQISNLKSQTNSKDQITNVYESREESGVKSGKAKATKKTQKFAKKP